jgi:hypothetical protein
MFVLDHSFIFEGTFFVLTQICLSNFRAIEKAFLTSTIDDFLYNEHSGWSFTDAGQGLCI